MTILAPGSPEAWERPEVDVSHLVTETDDPLDNRYTEKQQRLLVSALYSSWEGPPPMEDDGPPSADSSQRRAFVALANVGLFADTHQQAIVPDVMVSADVTFPTEMHRKGQKSYFVWEFGKVPDVVIEVVSNTEGGELDTKKSRYARMRIGTYVIWDPARYLSERELHVFELDRQRYRRSERTFFDELGIGLAVWTGRFEEAEERWLRWVWSDGSPLLTGDEHAARERDRAARERDRAERLAARLRALGIDPDEP
jgi:hypothetical protein